ncbi:hypothetical protein HY312_04240 [Candidatus Saccharibacteria bacterium]|nr:hypothetical protein [Candidatus Saccharibacteria bacterium]
MARLPQPGGDSGSWGEILNDFLAQSHKPDGAFKDNSVTSNVLAPNSVTNTALASDSVNASIIVDGSITEALLNSAVQSKLNATAPVTSVSSRTGDVTLTKSDVGLSNADNTSDEAKPISTAVQTALSQKAADSSVVHVTGNETVSGSKNFTGGITINGSDIVVTGDTRLSDQRTPLNGSVSTAKVQDGAVTIAKLEAAVQTTLAKADASVQSVAGKTGTVSLVKADVGLGNVDNTSDVSRNSATAIFTNKTINGSNNTITNVPLSTGVTGVLPIANGGTGGTSLNFVDLANNQTIGGAKTFSGTVSTGDNFNVGNVSSQRITFGGGDTNHGIEIGRTNGNASTPYIDFHSGATATDYDARLLASGGNGAVGQGVLTVAAGQLAVNGQLSRNTDVIGVSTYSTNTTLTVNSKSINLLNAGSSPFTVTLPSTTMAGIIFTLKKIDASIYVVTINPPSGGSIDGISGGSNFSLVRQNDYLMVMSTTADGVWNIVGGNINQSGVAQTDGGVIGRAPLHTISAEMIDQFVHMPNMFNDIMWNRQRGGSTIVTKNGVDLGAGSNDQYFMPDATFQGFGSLVSSDILQFTVTLCRTFIYATTWGIAFTGGSWQPLTSPTIEVWKDDVAAWQTLTVKKYAQGSLYMGVSGWSVTASKLRITVSGPFSVQNTIRICSIFALSFQTDLLSAGYLPRGGGQVYGKTGIATTSAPSTGVVRIGDDTTASTGGVQFGSDTVLFRSGAQQLRTDHLLVAGQLTTGGNQAQITGGIRFASTTRTANASLNLASDTVNQMCDATAGSITLTLPGTISPGATYTIKKIDASANTVTIAGTIDGVANYILSARWKWVTVISSTTSGSWYITGAG